MRVIWSRHACVSWYELTFVLESKILANVVINALQWKTCLLIIILCSDQNQ